MSAAEEGARLRTLLEEWREPGPLQRVRSRDVCPDCTNREQTLLSVEHVHYIARKMALEGFRPRDPSEASSDAHDIPVLVRAGGAEDALATASLAAWRARQEDHAGFPRCECDRGAFFTSLGNGHFTQALNLFRLGWPSIWDGQPWAPPAGASGDALRAALAHGVESLVLRAETPRGARKEISLLLNKAHDSKWHVDRASGAVVVTPPLAEVRVSQFDELSKVLDADELGALLRIKLRVDEAAADAGYAALLQSKL